MQRKCPICGVITKQNSDRCNTLGCGWRFLDLLSNSPTERTAYEEKIKKAKADYIDCQSDIEPIVTKDPFETQYEFFERLTTRAWIAGVAELKKENYDIETGTFLLIVSYRSWVVGSHDFFNHIILVSRDVARSIYENSYKYPIYAWLNIKQNNFITLKKLYIKTFHQELNIYLSNKEYLSPWDPNVRGKIPDVFKKYSSFNSPRYCFAGIAELKMENYDQKNGTFKLIISFADWMFRLHIFPLHDWNGEINYSWEYETNLIAYITVNSDTAFSMLENSKYPVRMSVIHAGEIEKFELMRQKRECIEFVLMVGERKTLEIKFAENLENGGWCD